ncbi:MAG TPA: 16S rRNA (cytosine(1402)-N(4))-methyltransferase RsmH [Candidatus Acidoferrales bacterium]|nr:16S rRNA (cytosine(1402)-N(4))-methyltransferase RsmH [Candidatus Acidoferrales bacterium]
MSAWHIPVLAGAVAEWLRIRPDGTYVDATVGTGGHALEIARRLDTGRLVGMDRDAQALELARERLRDYERRVTLVQANISRISEVVRELQLPAVDGLVADLGVSTLQLDTPGRGFSFRHRAPLDMRMDAGQPLTADEVVNTWREPALADLLFQMGEERQARRIARAIVRARPIRDTEHLATVVAGARKAKGRQKLHPATKTFLALRIAVNREMEELGQFLNRTPATLAPGARWAILSYHSLEDRMVKRAFQQLARTGDFRILTKKVVQPSEAEIQRNPRARSAKLRVMEKRAPEDHTPGPDEFEREAS